MIMDTDNGIELGLDTLTIKGDPTKLYENLAKAQAEFLPVPKMSEGQAGQKKFKYAGYATLMRCIRPALTAHGIAIIQPLHSREDMAITTTIIAGHGASISCSFSFKADYTKKFKDGTVVDDPQEFGRCHTYYRRYQLQAMLGIEGDSDADDLPDVNEEKAQFSEPSQGAQVCPKSICGAEACCCSSTEDRICCAEVRLYSEWQAELIREHAGYNRVYRWARDGAS
jgi:hypothetical protein